MYEKLQFHLYLLLAQLNNCLYVVRNVLGNTVPESQIKSVLEDKNYDTNATIDHLLQVQGKNISWEVWYKLLMW